MAAILDARMQRSRRGLRDALLTLLEEIAFDHITVREITARAHVGYATFFRHFASKEALLHDLAVSQISALLDVSLPLLLSARSRDACLAMCAHVHERRALWTALLTGGAAGTMREEFLRQSRLAAARSGRSRSSWLPSDLSVVWVTGGTVDVLGWWMMQKDRYSVAEVAEFIDRLIISPAMAGAHGDRVDLSPRDYGQRAPA